MCCEKRVAVPTRNQLQRPAGLAAADIPCLHIGLSANYAEVIWNESYRVPHDVGDAGADVCDYPLARNLIQFAVALASEAVIRFVLDGQQRNYSFTLRDLRINVEG